MEVKPVALTTGGSRHQVARRNISRQDWPPVHEAIPRRSVLCLLLRRYGIIAGTDNLITSGHDYCDVTGGSISGVIMKRKPPGSIKQIRTFSSNIGEPLGCEWSTFGRNQCAVPAKT